VLLDLYSGTGAIALSLACKARLVLGVEADAGAVRDARANAARNKISNAHFLRADLSTRAGVAAVAQRVPHPDTVVAGALHSFKTHHPKKKCLPRSSLQARVPAE
jgi:23S rRNA (uracil1939-C5)-methyltransferase